MVHGEPGHDGGAQPDSRPSTTSVAQAPAGPQRVQQANELETIAAVAKMRPTFQAIPCTPV